MTPIDLTLSIPAAAGASNPFRLEERIIRSGSTHYTGMVYHFAHDSMVGTYLDLPGHIKETDDGIDADTYPLQNVYRIPAAVLHLDRADRTGAVHADELADALHVPIGQFAALIVNALGERRFDQIEQRTVWLAVDAVQWIISTGVRLLVSDIYESTPELTGVFNRLFTAGISTVCCPINLHRLTMPLVRLTVLCPRFRHVTQVPCRVVAEEDADEAK